MNYIQLIRKKLIPILAIIVFSSLGAAAQDAAQVPAKQQEGSNLLVILLVCTTAVLALVIWGMGRALVVVSQQLMEKSKAAKKALNVILVIGLLMVAQSGFAQDAANAAETIQKATPNYGGLSANNFYAFVGVIMIEVAAIMFLAFSLRRIYEELLPAKVPAKSKSGWWSSLDKKVFTKAVAVEREADILLDHDYDGIRELDNSLPPWWKYGFYVTIVAAFVYMFYFHVSGSGKNPTEEYAAELEKAKIEKEAYEANNKDKVDENSIPMADADGLAQGKEIFTTKCWACHGKLGEGGAGPNLTDDYWIHKGSLNDIYTSIKVGYQDKGMQSWAKEFTPKEISYIASYIKTLNGTKPLNGKAPQGDLFTENKTDSLSSTKVDSTVTAIKAM